VQAWLINPLLKPKAQLNDRTYEWLRGLLESDAPAMLRARACLGLAAKQRVEVAQVARMFDALPSVTAPDLVAALAFLGPDAADPPVRAVIRSENLYRWIFEYASANAGDCSWA
jgi:hypothetical protein